MDLIVANEELDKSIAGLYDQIIKSTNETESEGHLSMLTMLKELRETIDEHINNLLEETEEEKIKKYVTNTMRGFIIDIGQKYKDCLDENCPTSSPECDSCGAEKVDEMREKMRQYKNNLNSQRGGGRQKGLHQGGPDQLHQQDQRGVTHPAQEE